MTSATPVVLIAALVPLILEAALRALLAALAVWAGMRLLSISNVLVQKAAWGLVLVAALALPMLPHWQVLPAFAALRLPALPQLAPVPTTKTQLTPVLNKARIETCIPAHIEVPPAATPVRPREAFSLSAPTNNFNTLESAASSLNAAPEQALSSSEPALEPMKGFSDTGLSSTGTGFRPYINQTKKSPDLAPAGPLLQSKPVPIAVPQPKASKSNPAPISLFECSWLLYLGVFGALLPGAQNDLGTDPFGSPGLFSAAPYWRAALKPHWGNHWLEIGTFGMYAPVRPWTMPGTLDDVDLSADGQLHRHRL